MILKKHQREWEELAEMDPFWTVLSDPTSKFGRWDPDRFFRTGEETIAGLMAVAAQLGHPAGRDLALDFGCGLGRLTRALAQHFRRCCGVDISRPMIAKARALHASLPNCEFLLNEETNLRQFPDDHFDLIYTMIVLQHMPNEETIRAYIAEFVRTLKPKGLLAFQLPSYIPPRLRFERRPRLYRLLRGLGVSPQLLYTRLDLHPIRMRSIPEGEVVASLEGLGGNVLRVQPDDQAGERVESRAYFVTK